LTGKEVNQVKISYSAKVEITINGAKDKIENVIKAIKVSTKEVEVLKYSEERWQASETKDRPESVI